MTHSVPIARTNLTEDEISSVLGPLRSGWLVQGPQVKSFEGKWCAFTGSPYSLAVTSCTTGMHLVLVALGLKPGDEVTGQVQDLPIPAPELRMVVMRVDAEGIGLQFLRED